MPGMMEKGSDYLGKGRSNGTKSPSNASNGHFSDESGSDDEHGEYSLEQPLLRAPPSAPANLTPKCACAAVLQMWGCGSEPTTRPTYQTSSPVSVALAASLRWLGGGSLEHRGAAMASGAQTEAT